MKKSIRRLLPDGSDFGRLQIQIQQHRPRCSFDKAVESGSKSDIEFHSAETRRGADEQIRGGDIDSSVAEPNTESNRLISKASPQGPLSISKGTRHMHRPSEGDTTKRKEAGSPAFCQLLSGSVARWHAFR